ncbi:unnamed protein product [Penicillium camemberti]|uniref:Str. FM013 n=1 Tax=Penicillium camemberti (strain FM 013) TaxID=1429867 RepID=A0A0G4PWU6_PENC3|nr:unnamed protein product [Penicillium camemberti]
MSTLVHDSPDRVVTAIEPLTGSDNFATWKRLMTSYLKARQVWDVVSGDLQRPDCLFKYAKPITADIHPLVEPHLNGAVRQRAIEARLEVEVQAFERHREWSRREAEAYHTIFRYLSPHISIHVAGLETSRDLWNELEERYRRMELATFCELFAQLRETTGERCGSAREFVDREDDLGDNHTVEQVTPTPVTTQGKQPRRKRPHSAVEPQDDGDNDLPLPEMPTEGSTQGRSGRIRKKPKQPDGFEFDNL